MNDSLPEISSYSENGLAQASSFSTMFSTYQRLSTQKSSNLSSEIRIYRHQNWLRCVLAELTGKTPSKEICTWWSHCADEIIIKVCDYLQTSQTPFSSKLALFAYGKLGSSELNLSSDIDLVLVGQDGSAESLRASLSFLRQFQVLIQDSTDFGFCFRTDFDLRPGGRMGPLVPTTDQFIDYYGNYGEAWERLAFVRLRPLWGDPQVISSIMTFVEKLTFRKHLDYSLLSDLKTLRQKIHSQYSHRTTEEQIDLKLGLGGIRDLELFIHALQIVHGGKDLLLRQKKTSDAFDQIEQRALLPETEIHFLRNHYWNLRHLENLVQAENDQQTHILKTNFPLKVDFSSLRSQMLRCDHIVSSLLGKVDLQKRTLPETEKEQRDWLLGLGYQNHAINEVWPELISTTALSRQKERDESYRLRFLYLFIHELSSFPESQNRSLYLLRDFIKATRAKATFYSLFLNQEKLIPQVARIFSASPYLAGILSSRPELIDSFVFKTQSPLPQDPETLLEALSERKLLSELVNGSEFLNTLDLNLLTERVSQTADSICIDLLTTIDLDCRLELLCLGKWGGQELGLRSDLDFILVTADDPLEKDIKTARRFFNRLTETHQKGGSLYSIDLRLKPSGKGGLVVTSLPQLIDYLSTKAEAWERQAYLRSRILTRHSTSGKILENLHQACLLREVSKDELKELERIRQGLLKNSGKSSDKIDLKYAEGGLVDIEFAVQISFLTFQQRPESPQTTKQLSQLGWSDLNQNYQFMRLVEQLHQAVSIASASCLEIDSEGFKFVSNLLNCSEIELKNRLNKVQLESSELLKRLDPRRTP